MVAPCIDDFAGTHQDTSRLNRFASVAGLPALAVPCGFTAESLPISMQLIGRAWEEPTLLRVAQAYERAVSSNADRRAPLVPGGGTRTRLATAVGATDCPPPDLDWMRAYADLMKLSFLEPDDFTPMARQLAPIKSQLARARSLTKPVQAA
jgi:hypothetical protein